MGNGCGGVSAGDLRGKSGRFLGAALAAQKFVNIYEARSREDAFIADVSVEIGRASCRERVSVKV